MRRIGRLSEPSYYSEVAEAGFVAVEPVRKMIAAVGGLLVKCAPEFPHLRFANEPTEESGGKS